ncbi:MAG: hypothetical protein J7L42_01490 [Elusimicrobia bacterium]|nr:hypothetical protein [Elusimicrobiota bacterium]
MRIKIILKELKKHMPFTLTGALTGILLMLFFKGSPHRRLENFFYVLHPLHVFLSALVTASMFKIHRKGAKLLLFLFVGYTGSIGIATISDSLIPFLGEALLKMPHRHLHIGFVEKWYVVNTVALLGIAVAYNRPQTKFPHAGHVFISTWASMFHILMAKSSGILLYEYVFIFVFLFLAVWLPCCVSDIVFPLFFVGGKDE